MCCPESKKQSGDCSVCTRKSLVNLELLRPILRSVVGNVSTKQDVLSQKEIKRWMQVFVVKPDG